jgi:hypothetical protein
MRNQKNKADWGIGLAALLAAGMILGAPQAVAAGGKSGSRLEIRTMDGSKINGELLAVKGTNLLLMTASDASGKLVSIDEVQTIRIVHKSMLLRGAGVGLLTGAGTGALIGLASGNDRSGWFRVSAGQKAAFLGVFLGGAGGLFGGILGGISGMDRTIQVAGTDSAAKARILAKLSRRARASESFFNRD